MSGFGDMKSSNFAVYMRDSSRYGPAMRVQDRQQVNGMARGFKDWANIDRLDLIEGLFAEYWMRHGHIVEDPEEADLYMPHMYHYHVFLEIGDGEAFSHHASPLPPPPPPGGGGEN
jgi:hypothetical protein